MHDNSGGLQMHRFYLSLRTGFAMIRLRVLIGLTLWMICPAAARAERTESRVAAKKNVLLICVDDLKPVLGCYGDGLAKTPNLDGLAQRSVLFEKAYCNQAVCSPSRNALMCSLRPQSLGIYDLETHFRKTAPDAVTLGEYFQKFGYKTEGMGKIFHVGHGNHDDARTWSVPSFRPKGSNYALPESTEGARSSKNGPRGAAFESADVPDEFYGDGKIAAEAVTRLQKVSETPDQPFFMAVGFLKPHLPFVAPKKYWDLIDPTQIQLAKRTTAPEGAPAYAPQLGGELRGYKDMPGQGAIDESTQRTLIHGYYAAASYMDAQVGKVLAELERSGLSQNTIVVLWGDHGWHLGDHGMWCKHTNYEQAARIPLLISAPGKKQGVRTNALVETVDIYPTLAELAGLPAPEGIDGKSFAAILDNPRQMARDHVIHVYPRNAPGVGQVVGRAVRNDRYRLVEWKKPGASDKTAEYELYDYATDPLESKNLAAEQTNVLAEMKKFLAKHPEAKPQWKDPKAADSQNASTSGKPKQDRNAMFERRDANRDGSLTKDEFMQGQPDPEEAPSRFLRFDKDKNGVLSRDEFVHSGK